MSGLAAPIQGQQTSKQTNSPCLVSAMDDFPPRHPEIHSAASSQFSALCTAARFSSLAQMFGDGLGIPNSHAMAFWLCSCILFSSGLDAKDLKKKKKKEMKQTFHLLANQRHIFTRSWFSWINGILDFVKHSTYFLKRRASFKLLIVVLNMILLSQWRWRVRITWRVGSLLMTTDVSWSLPALRPWQTHTHSSCARITQDLNIAIKTGERNSYILINLSHMHKRIWCSQKVVFSLYRYISI